MTDFRMSRKPVGSKWVKAACSAVAIALAGYGGAASAADFSLEALIEAAKGEKPITVYASTGKIKKATAAFTKKYGVKATGTKITGAAQIELVVREAQSGNIIGDVIISSDAAAAKAQLLGEKMVTSWFPPDLAGSIPKGSQMPLVVWRDPAVWTYNDEKAGSCPVGNIWELTGKKWNRRIAMEDPLHKPSYIDWFNQMETHSDDAVAAAYKAHFGKELDRSKQSATATWVEGLAKNAPLLGKSSSNTAKAVGTPGQDNPFFGMMSAAKYRKTGDGGLKMSICKDIQPHVGYYKPGFGLIAKGTKSPNAAKLFLHYMMTEEGVEPMTRDGKMSGNSAVPPHPKERSGVVGLRDRLTPYVSETGADDFDKRQDWQDFWRIHYTR
jgi:iron(III) transport system substrate-binding protein